MNISEQQKIDDDNIINRNKFPLNKLFIQFIAMKNFSILKVVFSDGKDIL